MLKFSRLENEERTLFERWTNGDKNSDATAAANGRWMAIYTILNCPCANLKNLLQERANLYDMLTDAIDREIDHLEWARCKAAEIVFKGMLRQIEL